MKDLLGDFSDRALRYLDGLDSRAVAPAAEHIEAPISSTGAAATRSASPRGCGRRAMRC